MIIINNLHINIINQIQTTSQAYNQNRTQKRLGPNHEQTSKQSQSEKRLVPIRKKIAPICEQKMINKSVQYMRKSNKNNPINIKKKTKLKKKKKTYLYTLEAIKKS